MRKVKSVKAGVPVTVNAARQVAESLKTGTRGGLFAEKVRQQASGHDAPEASDLKRKTAFLMSEASDEGCECLERMDAAYEANKGKWNDLDGATARMTVYSVLRKAILRPTHE